jgi:hypothetical protein
MYDTLRYQFLWTYFTLSPNTGKHYNLLYSVSFYGMCKYNTCSAVNYWSDTRLRNVTKAHFQLRFSVKICAESLGTASLDPNNWRRYECLCYPNYVYTSKPFLLQVKVKKIVSTHVVPPHISRQVTVSYFNRRYPKYWFGRFGPWAWLVTSPDVTSLYHFLWKRHMKDTASQQTSQTREQLQSADRIRGYNEIIILQKRRIVRKERRSFCRVISNITEKWLSWTLSNQNVFPHVVS